MGRDEVHRARPALRPRRRVHGGRARPLGHLGGRRHRPDKASGLFADPDKVHRLDHKGEFYKSRGPFTVPRSRAGPPGRDPGRAERPRQAASRALGRADLRRLPEPRGRQARLRRASRPPSRGTAATRTQCRSRQLVYPVVGETKAEAEDKRALIEQAADRDRRAVAAVRGAQLRLRDARAWTSRSPTRSSPASPGCRRMRDRVLQVSGKREPDACATSSQFSRPRHARTIPWSAARRKSPTSWRSGSSSAPATASSSRRPTCPGAYEDFVRLVVPELQRRGLFRKDYAGTTLRDHLGLPIPGWPPGAGRIRRRANNPSSRCDITHFAMARRESRLASSAKIQTGGHHENPRFRRRAGALVHSRRHHHACSIPRHGPATTGEPNVSISPEELPRSAGALPHTFIDNYF